MTSKLPRGLIGWAIAAAVGTCIGLALQLWIWIVLALRPVSHGSGDYLGFQYAALVLSALPSVIALGVVIRFMLRHGRRRSSVLVLVADIVCLTLVGVLIVPPALTVFRFAPTDDAVFHERARLGYFVHGDPGSEFRPDDAQYVLQKRVDAIAHDLGFEDDDIPYDKAPGDATHHARPGISPAGNPCTTYFESFTLPSSVDQGRAQAEVSATWAKQSAARAGDFVDRPEALVFTLDAGGSIKYTPENRTFVTQTECLIDEPARPLGD